MLKFFKKIFKKNDDSEKIGYVDRGDGFGSAGAENQKRVDAEPSVNDKKNDDGSVQQQGEVDQYSFRERPLN